MSLRKPPALATWLLNRVRLPETNPPLAGDLLEEFQSGRSSAWYWRQTIKAIATTLGHNARARIPAILLGWAIQAGIACAFCKFYSPDIPLHVLIPVIMIAISNLMIVGMVLGVQRINRLGHVVDPMRTRFIPLAIVMGWVLANEGGTPWKDFAFVACLWLAGLMVYGALRQSERGPRLRLPKADPAEENPSYRGRLQQVFFCWFWQEFIADKLRHLNLPPQIPLRFLVPGALIILSAALIVWLVAGNPARQKLRFSLHRLGRLFHTVPAVRAVAYLGFYCLIALCVRLPLIDYELFEFALLLDMVVSIPRQPKRETA